MAVSWSIECGCMVVEGGDGSINFCRFHADAPKLLTALRNLYDEQNGPPLIRDKDTWASAMDEALALLEKHETKAL